MKKRLYKVLRTYSILFIIFLSYYFLNKYVSFSIPCVFNELTGLKCPGCGITRCLFHLINLDFREAFYDNPLVFIYLPFIIFYFLYLSYLYVYDKKDNLLIKIPNSFKYLVLIITIIYGIIRNIYFL